MDIVSLVIINFKRYIKNPIVLLMTFALPLIVLFGVNFKATSSNVKIIVIDNDKSNESKELIKKMENEVDVTIKEGKIKSYYEDVEKDDYKAIYVIPDEFEMNIKAGSYCNVNKYAIKDNTNTTVQLIDEITDNFVKSNVLKSKGIKYNYKSETEIKNIDEDETEALMNVLMLCYFMSICSSTISQDIIKMKLQNVLKRSLTTCNSDRKILGGIYLAVFLLEVIGYGILVFITKYCLGVEGINFGYSILAITLSAAVTTAMIIFFTRYIKNPTISSFAMTALGLVFFILAMCNSLIGQLDNVPFILSALSSLSPLYWIANILSGSKVVFSSGIVLLMSLVYFTLGSFKLREYIKN